jgi:SAM-dependent methyltransferase
VTAFFGEAHSVLLEVATRNCLTDSESPRRARGHVRTSTPCDIRSGTELDALAVAHTYYHSILTHFAPYVGKRIVEVGAGVGTFSHVLLQHTDASDLTLIEPADNLFSILKDRFSGETRVKMVHTSAEDLPGSLVADSVVLVNVLEHVADDRACLQQVHRILAPEGALLIFVPALPFLFGTLDEHFGHHRRYTKPSLGQRLLEAGFRLLHLRYFNLPGVVTWFVAGRVLKRRTLQRQDVGLYERWVAPWISRLERRWEPPIGQSLLAVARRRPT